MRNAKAVLSILLLCAMAYAQAPAQTPADDGDAGDAVFHSDTRLVEVHATVTDANGRLLTDVPRGAFRIYENDVQQEIKGFRREDAPVSLGLVIDDSASMLMGRAQVATAALELV